VGGSVGAEALALGERELSFLFALLAGFSNALNLVAQHVASISAPPGRRPWQLALYLVRHPLWVLGAVALVGAFVFQAVALHLGELSLVQPLLVSELIFALVLRRLWIGQDVALAAWGSAVVMCVGLALFIVMAEPRGGGQSPTSLAWLSAVLSMSALAAVLAALARDGSPERRAALYGTSSAVVWALEATFIKATTDSLTTNGVVATLARWEVYALIVGGICGTVLVQAALHVGPLSASQPLIVAVDPFVSIILSVWLFRERFTDDPAEIAVGCVAFVIMVVGIVLITRTAGPVMAGPDRRA
jgi:drug/metabolite transporter (DMT)-like permease